VQQIAKLKQEEEQGARMACVAYGETDGLQPLKDNAIGQTILSGQESSDPSDGAEFFEQAPKPEGLSHNAGIEVMTGLFYGDGEQSQGLGTGVRRGRLVHCDIDITTAADQARNVQEGDRRKKLKGQHVCNDCGTADSPEWRKGPSGPKTLCNACGCKCLVLSSCFEANLPHLVRWSKKRKNRQEYS
jgi:hypothetical protein